MGAELEWLFCWRGRPEAAGGEQQLSRVCATGLGWRKSCLLCTWENLLLTGVANKAPSIHTLRLAFSERGETLLLPLSLPKKSFVPTLILIFSSFLFSLSQTLSFCCSLKKTN